MDKINNDPNRKPFLPFPPEKKEINNEVSGQEGNPIKKPIEEPFLPFPPVRKIDNTEPLVSEKILEDKAKLSWKTTEEKGFDLNQIKDTFIKSESIM